MLIMNLEINNIISLNVNGRMVEFHEYKSINEDDFVKVCTCEHKSGVGGEYIWIQNKYPHAVPVKQKITSIIINKKEVKCDVLTIKTIDEKIKNVYFDISQMMENLMNRVIGETDKKHWHNKAKEIYDKLLSEYGFLIDGADEENLYKSIDENVSIGFDITFFFGFIVKNKHLNKALRIKYENIIKKYMNSGFIENIILEDELMGGYIKIDHVEDNIIFAAYKSLEEEAIGE